MNRLLLILALIVALIVGGWYFWPRAVEPVVVSQIIPPTAAQPNAQTIVAVTLKSVRQQNKIVPMESEYVAVVTSDETRLGIFHSRKTLIMPGRFRYQIDLSKLRASDLHWDPVTKVLNVHLPAIEVDGPDIDLTKAKHFADGVLTTFASIDTGLEDRNLTAGRQQLITQAHDAQTIHKAQIAAERAVQDSFSMPMRAAGINATVEASF